MALIRYIVFLLALCVVFCTVMFPVTAILLWLNSFVFVLGAPIALIVVMKVKPLIGRLIYKSIDSVHKTTDAYDKFISMAAYFIVVCCIGFLFYTNESEQVDILGRSLKLTLLFSGYMVVGAIMLQILRRAVSLFKKDKPDLQSESIKYSD